MTVRDHRRRTEPFHSVDDLRAWVESAEEFSWTGDDIANGELGFDAVEAAFEEPELKHFLIDLKYKIGSITVGKQEIDLSNAERPTWLYDDERLDAWNQLSKLLSLGVLEEGLDEAGVDIAQVDGIAGIPTGGRFLSETFAHVYGLKSCYVKDKAKDYGSGQMTAGEARRRVEGHPFEDDTGLGLQGENWMVIDDVTTTGKSVEEAIDVLTSDGVGAEVTHVVLLGSREDVKLAADYDDPRTYLAEEYNVDVIIAGYTSVEMVNVGHRLGHVSDEQYRRWAETADVEPGQLRMEP